MGIDWTKVTTIGGLHRGSDGINTVSCEMDSPEFIDRLNAISDEHSPAEFEKHLSRLTDERLLQECAQFSKAALTAFETAALIDELCDRLRKQLDLD